MAAIKFGVSPPPVYVVYDRRIYWRRQILAKTRNSSNSPNIIARQNLFTVNQQILACYYIWRIWRIACFRQYLSPPTYTSIVHCIDGPRRDTKFNSRQINVNRFILRNAKFYSRQNLLIYSIYSTTLFLLSLIIHLFLFL